MTKQLCLFCTFLFPILISLGNMQAENYVKLTTKKVVGSRMGIIVRGDNNAKIRWEDGSMVPLSEGKSSIKSQTFDIVGDVTQLEAEEQQLTSVDLSHTSLLDALTVPNNELQSLILPSQLGYLDCADNMISELDLSSVSKLRYLDCANNKLSQLDVTGLSFLRTLRCQNNNISKLILKDDDALRYIYCFNNNLSGNSVDELITSLPTVQQTASLILVSKLPSDRNRCSKAQVKAALIKNFQVQIFDPVAHESSNYSGSDDEEKTYRVTLKSNELGSISIREDVDLNAILPNTKLSVDVHPNNNCFLSKLTANEIDITQTKSFEVVDRDVIISAVFRQKESPKEEFKVVLKSNDLGHLYVDDKNVDLNAVSKGTLLSVIAKPNDGCYLDLLTANGVDIIKEKQFVVTDNTVVEGVFKKKEEKRTFELGYVASSTDVQVQSGMGNFPSMMKVGFAIKLPKSYLTKYVGAHVKGIKIGWAENRTGKCTAFVTSKLGSMNVSKSAESQIGFGWNSVFLQSDYEVTKDTEDLYFGYYTEVGPKEYPVAAQFYGKVPNSCFSWKSDEVTKDNKEIWADRVRELGMPYIRVILEAPMGAFENDVELTDSKYLEIQSPGKVMPVRVTLKNYGVNQINKLTVETKLNDKISEETFELKKPYAANSSVETYLPLNIATSGKYLMRISKVNDIDNKCNVYDTLNIMSIPKEVSGKYKRKILIELFTSESAHKWPSVNKDFFAPGLEAYDGPKVVVAHHMTDQYMLNEDEGLQLSLKLCNNDSTKVYTYESAVDRTCNPEFKYADLETPKCALFAPEFAALYYAEMAKVPAFASVNINSKIENNKIVIDVTGDVAKDILNKNENPSLTVYLTENDVISTSQEFTDQEEKDEYGGKFAHNYVIRDIPSDTFGDSVELSEDGTYHKRYEIEVEKEWSLKNMDVVATLGRSIDNGAFHMQVLNSNSCKIEGVESTELIDGSGTAVIAYQDANRIAVSGEHQGYIIYNMKGEIVDNSSLAEGVYLVKIKTFDKEVVRKVIIK